MKGNRPPDILLHGARQNNLKGIDLEVSPGQLVVFTGLSGTGKSTLLFDVLHAEGQRKYVETFSPYVRQFLETCQRPEVDSIENIRPSISVEQKNTIRNSRSTVGTMTETCDYFKVWFPLVAKLTDPASGKPLHFETFESQARATIRKFNGQNLVIGFQAKRPSVLPPDEFLKFLTQAGHVRSLSGKTFVRIENLIGKKWCEDSIFVVTDRIPADKKNKGRITEAISNAIRHGQGLAQARDSNGKLLKNLHEGLRSQVNGRKFSLPVPPAFSFTSRSMPELQGFWAGDRNRPELGNS